MQQMFLPAIATGSFWSIDRLGASTVVFIQLFTLSLHKKGLILQNWLCLNECIFITAFQIMKV